MANYDSTHTGATIDSAVSQVTDSTTDLNIDSNTLVVDKSANSVGIGTDAPAAILEIQGADGTVSGTPEGDANELVIRNDGDCGINILAGESAGETSGIVFGSTSDINGANIHYDANAKLFRLGSQIASAEVSIRTGNGAEAMRIDSSGNVGIGNSAPKSLLQVDGENAAGVITISHGGASNSISDNEILGTIDFAGYDLTNTYAVGAKISTTAAGNWSDASTNYAGTDLEFYTQSDTTTDTLTSPRMVINKDGKVGIGVAAPINPLHVVTSSLTNVVADVLRIDNTGTGSTLSGTGAGLTFVVGDANAGPSNVGFIWGQQTGEGGTWDADASLNFRSGNVAPSTTNAHMTILPTGNVGIGTAVPINALHIKAGNGTQLCLDNSGEQFTQVNWKNDGDNKCYDWWNNTATDFVRQSSGHISFNTGGGNERLRITSAGNVGIGQTAPGTGSSLGSTAILHIGDSDIGGSSLIFEDNEEVWEIQNNDTLGFYNNAFTSPTAVLQLMANDDVLINNGNVGIQETTPSKMLDVYNGAAGGDILCEDIYTHDGAVETSDERLKENIVDSALGLNFINILKPRSFKWKDTDEIVEKKTVEKQKTVKVEKEVTRTDIVEEDGKYIQKEITETQEVDEPVFEEVPLYGEDGEQLMRLVSEAVEAVEGVDAVEAVEEELWAEDDDLPEDIEIGDVKVEAVEEVEAVEAIEAQDAVYEGIVHRVPVMEEVEEILNQYDAHQYTRTHYGMISQEVKQVMDDLNLSVNDFAGWAYEEDRDVYVLRYTEFISPLIKAVQELSAKVEALENA